MVEGAVHDWLVNAVNVIDKGRAILYDCSDLPLLHCLLLSMSFN